MKLQKLKLEALVLAGDGINCENETAAACRDGGFQPTIMHVNDLLAKPAQLSQYKLFVLPGGFSFGDELGSGKILALKLRHGLKEELAYYLKRGGLVFGICNGFQVLTKLGVFGEGVLLAHNRQGQFLNRWVELAITGRSRFTDRLVAAGVQKLELPMRHGEGRLVFASENLALKQFEEGSCVLRYAEDVNGSWNQVAALSSYEGRVMGMMPHPEAFWCAELHPWGESRPVPLGTALFVNAYQSLADEVL